MESEFNEMKTFRRTQQINSTGKCFNSQNESFSWAFTVYNKLQSFWLLMYMCEYEVCIINKTYSHHSGFRMITNFWVTMMKMRCRASQNVRRYVCVVWQYETQDDYFMTIRTINVKFYDRFFNKSNKSRETAWLAISSGCKGMIRQKSGTTK
jgi:hypothetical protein